MSAKYPSISAGSASVSRSGNKVTVTVRFTATNGNSEGVYARYMQFRIGGTTVKTSAANEYSTYYDYTYETTDAAKVYGGYSSRVTCELWIQVTSGYSKQDSAYRDFSWGASQFVITFDPNTGETTTNTKTVTYGQTYGDLPVPTKNGYSFSGWFTQASGGTEVKSTDTVSITANTTLYAHWEAQTIVRVVDNNSVTTYTKVYAVKDGEAKHIIGLYIVRNGQVKQAT